MSSRTPDRAESSISSLAWQDSYVDTTELDTFLAHDEARDTNSSTSDNKAETVTHHRSSAHSVDDEVAEQKNPPIPLDTSESKHTGGFQNAIKIHTTAVGEAESARWGIYWRSPALMAAFYLAGIAFSMGHHGYYSSLNNTIAGTQSQQQWSIRIGTGLAFLTKTCLAAVISIAFVQFLWVYAKGKQGATLAAFDAMFSLTSNPLSIFSRHVLRRAKVLALLASVSWYVSELVSSLYFID